MSVIICDPNLLQSLIYDFEMSFTKKMADSLSTNEIIKDYDSQSIREEKRERYKSIRDDLILHFLDRGLYNIFLSMKKDLDLANDLKSKEFHLVTSSEKDLFLRIKKYLNEEIE